MNTKVRYGLRTMLAIERNQHTGGVLQKDISAEEGISIKYLDAIISSLRSAGLIANYSGKRSGYVLTRDSKNISVYDVFRAFEPPVEMANCSWPICERKDECKAAGFWMQLNSMITERMSSSSLYELNSNNN